MKTRKFLLALAVVALAALVVPAVANANFAIHGNYVDDDDACAGCHRAHTSVSTITWAQTPAAPTPATNRSALLVSTASEMWQFCYACHGADAQGADTNVQEGIYEGNLYGTQGAILNGGGFESFDTTFVTSTHMYRGDSWGAYGGGFAGAGSAVTGQPSFNPTASAGESPPIKMDCTTCHDPHGSANYRILKATVNGNAVGGYGPGGTAWDPDPNGFVSSVETGWPANGFRLHRDYPSYQPNYTTPLYAKGYDQATLAQNRAKGMSGWCAGCHSTYNPAVGTFVKASDGTNYEAAAVMYQDGDGAGYLRRHRHPMNVQLNTYQADDAASMVITNSILPLAHDITEQGAARANAGSDWIECLTCHRAHGSIAVMTGYASNPASYGLPPFPGPGDPSDLLRLDNRGVCEACHNK